MPDTLAHTLPEAVGSHLVEDLGIDLRHAIDRAARELERAATFIRHDADDVFGKAFDALNAAADALAGLAVAGRGQTPTTKA